ncbi:MAG: ABC transporter ATP-binding protein [Gammaproteobacteria bacterium]|nr:ABC transporter ATP-binding protein [Gammaproteobacteria bacterium]
MRLELTAVSKAFNQGRPNEFWAIKDLSLEIQPNQVTCLKGASGSGKTTLLSMIGCLSRPTSGRIVLGDKTLSGLPERFLTDIRRHTFGFIFQQFNLIHGLTVLENVMLPAYPLGLNRHDLAQKATALLDQFGLGDRRADQVQWLSGGEKQRVAICRALINDPEILIADEPTANLDTKLSHEFMQLIATLRTSEKSILITSHDPVVFESTVVDRVVEMCDGRVVES